MGSIYCYIRVSSRDQHEDRQLITMNEYGIPKRNFYVDKQSGKDLIGTFLSDIVLQVLSFVAENERQNIRQRQAEGIAAAKAKGVKFGRPQSPLPEHFEEVFLQWKNGEISGKKAASLLGMPASTFLYKAKNCVRQTALSLRSKMR